MRPMPEERSDNPIMLEIISLRERTARLEERVGGLEETINGVKSKLDRIDSRLWYLLSSVIASIILQIFWRLI